MGAAIAESNTGMMLLLSSEAGDFWAASPKSLPLRLHIERVEVAL